MAEADVYGFSKSKAGGGLLTDLPSEPTRRVLRLAVQGSLMKGDDVEESQLRISSTTAADDECVEFWPRWCLGERSVLLHRLWEPRNRAPSTPALQRVRRAALGEGRVESLRAG